MPLAAFDRATPPELHQVEEATQPLTVVRGTRTLPLGRGGLLITARRLIGQGLDRLQDPQPEGLLTRGLTTVKPWVNLGALPLLTLTNAFGLFLVTFSFYISVWGYGVVLLEAFFIPGPAAHFCA